MDRDAIFNVTLKRFLEPVGEYLDDDRVSEIMINGVDEIYIERHGMIEKTDARFEDDEKLLAAARNIAQYTNKRITSLTTRFDSRLPDGSRVHVIMPRCSRNGLCISIRKFRRAKFSLEDLVETELLTPEAKEYIEIVVALERNLLVSGGTGSGKTTLLNAISGKIPETERVIVIEDSSELQLQQPHVLSFETAWPDRHGQGAVGIGDLFHSALRMRPDRIIIGECRGGEALDLIQAMTSGHGGSMSTLHANTPLDALNRLETMALMSGVEIPLLALRSQIVSAIDVIIQISRLSDGRRMVTEIGEVDALSTENRYRVNQIFGGVESMSGNGKNTTVKLSWSGRHSIFGGRLKLQGIGAGAELTRKIFFVENGIQGLGGVLASR
ncbi:MAG TPA: ATPase, T2SS/T4P/T4SS family [Blastocatellia bacterium]|jgi:pilus assembly protein CpaF|nr:ATPase, T2SS/T4P/T4SS family [Blastocatellia bacterium]